MRRPLAASSALAPDKKIEQSPRERASPAAQPPSFFLVCQAVRARFPSSCR